jgi:ribonuclease P protein component
LRVKPYALKKLARKRVDLTGKEIFQRIEPLNGELKEAFPKQIRVLKAAQYRKIYQVGRRKNGQLLQLIYTGNELTTCRFGISVGKKFGGAVQRNWLKRQIREAVRKNRLILTGHWDIIFYPRPKTECSTFSAISEDVIRLFRQLQP